MSQEIPATFTEETGWPCEEECALVTSITTPKEWPLKFHRFADVSSGSSAVSVGGGWAKFILDQNLGVGAFLTFEVVDDRRLVVAHHQRCAASDFEQPQRRLLEFGLVNHCEGEPPEDDAGHRREANVLPDVRSDDRPQFCKTIRKTHLKKHDSSRIVSANPTTFTVLCGSFMCTHIMAVFCIFGHGVPAESWRRTTGHAQLLASFVCDFRRMCQQLFGALTERQGSMACGIP